MTYFYTGTPGSGKSLHLAKMIRNWLKKGSLVIANFPVNTDCIKCHKDSKFVYMPMEDMQAAGAIDRIKKIIADYGFEHRSYIVFDECQILWNSRSWNKKDRLDWVQFFTVHRHYGHDKLDCILVTQKDTYVDKQIRAVVEFETRHKKVSNVNGFGLLMSLPFRGQLFVAVTDYYGQHDTIGKEFIVGRKSLFDIYDTHAMFD